MKQKFLIIHDDQKLNTLLINYLQKFGFEVITATHPEAGLRLMKHENPDLVILDVMLPDIEEFKVCKMIRETSPVPIITLTARGEVTDRIVGLELGPDDDFPKPFEPREQILDGLRGIEWDAFNCSVDVLISRLRPKLNDDPKNPRFIKTV